MQCIAYTQDDGLVIVVHPSPESGLTIAEMAQQAVPEGKAYVVLDTSALPSDGSKSESWVLHEDGTITADKEPTTEELVAAAISKRDALLASSDWTQTLDAPLTSSAKSAWATYRQALRDIPTQADFPTSVVWPTHPEVVSDSDLLTASNSAVIKELTTQKAIESTKKLVSGMEAGAQKTALMSILTVLEGSI